jgi:hypothetical protein
MTIRQIKRLRSHGVRDFFPTVTDVDAPQARHRVNVLAAAGIFEHDTPATNHHNRRTVLFMLSKRRKRMKLVAPIQISEISDIAGRYLMRFHGNLVSDGISYCNTLTPFAKICAL